MLLHQWQCADSTGGTNCRQSAGYQRLALTKWLKQGSQKKEWEQQRQSEMCFWESLCTPDPVLLFSVCQIQWLRHLLGTLKHGCSYIWCLVLPNCENHELSLWPIRKLDWRREEEWLGVDETYMNPGTCIQLTKAWEVMIRERWSNSGCCIVQFG